MKFDPSKFKTNDWGVVGAAVVAFLAMFFHAFSYKFSVDVATVHESSSGGLAGWHFKALILALLLLLAAGAFVVVKVQELAPIPDLPLGPKLAVLVVNALAAVIVLLRIVTYPSSSASGLDGSGSAGAGFGSYLMLIAAIVAVVFSAMAFKESGEKLPTKADFQGLGSSD